MGKKAAERNPANKEYTAQSRWINNTKRCATRSIQRLTRLINRRYGSEEQAGKHPRGMRVLSELKRQRKLEKDPRHHKHGSR